MTTPTHYDHAAALDAYEGWLRVFRRPRTVDNRLHYARRLCQWASGRDRLVWDLTPADLADWLRTVGQAPATRKNAADAVSTLFNWGLHAGLATSNPVRALPRISVPRGLPRPTPDHVLRAAVARATRPQDVLMLLLGSLGGLRVSEMALLQREHISDGQMRVTGKGGHLRVVPVHPLLEEALALAPSTGWLFPSDRNPSGHMLPASIAQRLGDLLDPGWSAHTLRHRFATHVYSSSHDILGLRDLLGHADVSTTMVYTRVTAAKLARDVATISTLPNMTERVQQLTR